MPFSIHLFRGTLRGPESAPARERALNAMIFVINRLRCLPFVQGVLSRRWFVVI
jgi:hypothetical protein